MGIRFLEHILILTDDPDGTRDWWCKVLGFRSGDHPDFGFPVHWLYIGETPVIHIAEWQTYTAHSGKLGIPVTTPAPGTGALDHVAFNGTDANDMARKLDRLGIPYHRHEVPHVGLTQLFLNAPNGIKIELNYR